MKRRGELLKSYFVPNGSYLMELAEDGSSAPQVTVLQDIGKAIDRSSSTAGAQGCARALVVCVVVELRTAEVDEALCRAANYGWLTSMEASTVHASHSSTTERPEGS